MGETMDHYPRDHEKTRPSGLVAARHGLKVLAAMAAVGLAACTFDTSGLEWPGVCGNGVAEGQEACDILDFRGETCESLGNSPGVLACQASCVLDTSGCAVSPYCGDGVRQVGEHCDGADLGGASCASLGLGSGALLCTAMCALDTSGCSILPVCGNGQLEGVEECDDGNGTACDGCSPTCQTEGCGNGRWECSEECDDGNTNPGDGCDAQCRLETLPNCGDGNQDEGEECDDGNGTACDGCSPACLSESCGNGRVECAEACDDGNSDPTDVCLNDCTAAFCGDGVILAGVELCDVGSVPSTCQAQGYGGGTLGCAPGCLAYDTSGCTSADGDPCTSSAQCEGGLCYDEAAFGWPAGFCTRDCGNLGSPCPSGLTCIDLTAGGGAGQRCYELCASSSECRPGYVCERDPFQNVYLVCRPLCESNAHCPDTGLCDPWTGRCNSQASPADLDNGAACSGSTAPYCKGACWTQPSGGYCISPCNTSTGVCPGDGVCRPSSDLGDGDPGWCMDGCANEGDCRPDQYCRAVTGPDYCWPDGW